MSGRTATARSSSPSIPPRWRARCGGWSRTRASRPSPCRTCGPSSTRPTSGPRSRRCRGPSRACRWSRARPCTRRSGSTSAPPSPSSTPTCRVRSAGSRSSRPPSRTSGLAVPLLLVHSGGGSITVGEARRQPLGLAASGPAAGVAAAVAFGRGKRRRQPRHLRHGRARRSTCRWSRAGEPARRTRGELMGVWTALSLIDVRVDRRRRRVARMGRRPGHAPGRPPLGRRGAGAGLLRPWRSRRHGHRRPRGARVHRPGPVPGRATSPSTPAPPARPAGAWASLSGWAPRRRPGASDRSPWPAWSRRRAPGSPPSASTPETHPILSFGGSGSLFTPDIARRPRRRPGSLVPRAGVGALGVRRRHHRRAARAGPLRARHHAGGPRARAEADGRARHRGGRRPGRRRGRPGRPQRPASRPTCGSAKQVYELQLPVSTTGIDDAALERLLDDFQDEYAKRYGKGSIVLGAPVELVEPAGDRDRRDGAGHPRAARPSPGAAAGGATQPAPPVGHPAGAPRAPRGAVRRRRARGHDLRPGPLARRPGRGRRVGHDDLGPPGLRARRRRARHAGHGGAMTEVPA